MRALQKNIIGIFLCLHVGTVALAETPTRGSTEKLDWWQKVALYIPNRILDLVDVFRVDAGIGPTAGGVIRITRAGQIGYRSVNPFSARIGDFGREFPAIIESHNEQGFGGGYQNSSDRKVCPGEVGLGLDLGVGLYLGVCFDELYDFGAGILTFDPLGDDY